MFARDVPQLPDTVERLKHKQSKLCDIKVPGRNFVYKMAMSLKEMGLLYDEQFNGKIKIAKFLVKNLRDKREMQLAKKWLVRVCNIKSPVLEVKKNRNAFLSYMIKVLSDGVLTSCLDSEPNTVCDPDNTFAFLDDMSGFDPVEATPEEPKRSKKIKFHSSWSKDHRTYTAVKPIPGRGALVYLASSKRPGLENWDLPSQRTNEK